MREHRAELTPLLELGAGLRAATASLSGAELRTLGQQQHRLISALVGQARSLAAAGGRTVNADQTRGLEETLHAALADEGAANELMTGRLTETLHRSGLGSGGFGGTAAGSSRAGGSRAGTVTPLKVRPPPLARPEPAASRAARPRRPTPRRIASGTAVSGPERAAQAEREAAAVRLDQARAALKSAEADADQATAQWDRATATVDRLRAELERATAEQSETERTRRRRAPRSSRRGGRNGRRSTDSMRSIELTGPARSEGGQQRVQFASRRRAQRRLPLAGFVGGRWREWSATARLATRTSPCRRCSDPRSTPRW